MPNYTTENYNSTAISLDAAAVETELHVPPQVGQINIAEVMRQTAAMLRMNANDPTKPSHIDLLISADKMLAAAAKARKDREEQRQQEAINNIPPPYRAQ